MSGFGAFLGGLSGGTIGASVVSLILDTKRFDAGLVGAKGRLTTSNVQMTQSTSKFAALAQTAYLAAGAAAVAFAASSVKAAIEAQEAQLKLANSIENSEVVAGSAAVAFTEQADALRQLTGVDDEAIIGAQAFLVQMGLTEDQIRSLTPLVVDLSVKMGVDLETAAKAVGKSVNGTTVGLSRMGVVVDTTKAKTDAYGATLEALGVAQGFAAEKAESQPWVLLQSDFEELSETIGLLLLPALQDMVDQFKGILDPVLSVIQGMEDLADAAPGVSSGLGDILSGLRPMQLHFNPFLESLQAVTNFGEPVQVSLSDIGVSTAELAEMFELGEREARRFLTRLGFIGGTADEATDQIRRFANLSTKEINAWRRDTIADLREASLKIGGLGDDWQQTARQTVNAARRMARDAQQVADDLDALADIRAPDTFKKWLVDQGPGWVSGYVDATAEGRNQIEGYWADAADSVRTQKSALDEVIGKVNGVKQAIDNLPDRKVINVHLALTHSTDAGFPDNVADELAEELIRAQN